MSGTVTHVVPAPAFSAEGRAARPRPLFYRGAFVVSYPWARTLQICDYRRERRKVEVVLDLPPIAIDGDDEIDGIFTASSDGDIVHVL
jgi:hypothetical protein